MTSTGPNNPPIWRSRLTLMFALTMVLGVVVALSLKSDPQISSTKNYFKTVFLARAAANPAFEDQLSVPVAVAALAELLDENTSAFAAWYERAYPKMPGVAQKCLRPPIDRQRVLVRAVPRIAEFRTNAAPAVPALIRLLESTNQIARSLTVHAMGVIGPPSSNALPALLKGLHPTNVLYRTGVSGALVQIDPIGDLTALAWTKILSTRGSESWVSNVVENYLKPIQSLPGDEAEKSSFLHSDGNRWNALQTLGCMRFAAPQTTAPMILCLRDPSERIRAIAAMSLGRLGPVAKTAVPELRHLFKDDWAMVREAATNAIWMIERRTP